MPFIIENEYKALSKAAERLCVCAAVQRLLPDSSCSNRVAEPAIKLWVCYINLPLAANQQDNQT